MPGKKKKYNARFPPARIKKIMQSDDEVGKVAAAVPVIISRALELFVENLLSKANIVVSRRRSRTLTPSHVKLCIQSESRFDFLKDLVAGVADLQGDIDVDPTSTPVSTPVTTPASSATSKKFEFPALVESTSNHTNGRHKDTDLDHPSPKNSQNSKKRGRPKKTNSIPGETSNQKSLKPKIESIDLEHHNTSARTSSSSDSNNGLQYYDIQTHRSVGEPSELHAKNVGQVCDDEDDDDDNSLGPPPPPTKVARRNGHHTNGGSCVSKAQGPLDLSMRTGDDLPVLSITSTPSDSFVNLDSNGCDDSVNLVIDEDYEC